MSTSNYTMVPHADREEAAELLPLGSSRDDSDQPVVDAVPDDFKYGTTVSESTIDIRNEFVRKVYTIFSMQIFASCIVAGGISSSGSATVWVQTHSWSFYVPLCGTLINLGFLYWKRHSHPLNLILLTSFTLLEASALGIMIPLFDQKVMLQILLITLGIFVGLILFTLQSRYDVSGKASWLVGGAVALMMTATVGILFPFNTAMDIIFAIGGCLVFAGYVVHDTRTITKRLSPDEYILAAISLVSRRYTPYRGLPGGEEDKKGRWYTAWWTSLRRWRSTT